MMTARRRGSILAGAGIVVLFVWAALVDVPKLTVPIKGDLSTYVSMAFSLAKDGDLKYRAEDYRRFHTLYGRGPDGIFLKRTYRLDVHPRLGWPPIEVTKTAVPWTEGLDYGKPFAYAVLAAPFAGLLGLGGLLALNILMLALCVWCAVTFCRARLGRTVGTLFGVGFVGASIAPLYGAWLTPEIFNFTLVFVAYFLWLYKEVAPDGAARIWRDPRLDWVAAFLLGVATFSKPFYAPLVLPVLFGAFVRRQWRRFVITSALAGLGSVGLFAVNMWVSGDWNYQGGERNYYVSSVDRNGQRVDHFPFDGTTSFDTAGNPMATNEANDENIFAPDYLWPMLRMNAWYFLVGRDAGFIPYYFPGIVVLAWWLVRWRSWTVWQWTTLLAGIAAALDIFVIAPLSWNGGGGPVGNRYILPVYPVVLFLLPSGVGLVSSLAAIVVGLTFVGPMLLRPFAASQEPWLNPERWPLRLLPIELTLLSESLPVRLNPQRQRILVSEDPVVFLYYMDGKTYFQEPGGFWVAPGTTDIVIRTEHPLSSLDLKVGSGVDNEVDIWIGGRYNHMSLVPGKEQTVQLHPDPGAYVKSSYVVVLTIRTANGAYPRDTDPASPDERYLGVFIKPIYKVKPVSKN